MKFITAGFLQKAKEFWLRLTLWKRILAGFAAVYIILNVSFGVYFFLSEYLADYESERWMENFRARQNRIDASAQIAAERSELERIKAERGIADLPFDIPAVLKDETAPPSRNFLEGADTGRKTARQLKRGSAQDINYSAELAAYEEALKAQKEADEKRAKAEAVRKAEEAAKIKAEKERAAKASSKKTSLKRKTLPKPAMKPK